MADDYVRDVHAPDYVRAVHDDFAIVYSGGRLDVVYPNDNITDEEVTQIEDEIRRFLTQIKQIAFVPARDWVSTKKCPIKGQIVTLLNETSVFYKLYTENMQWDSFLQLTSLQHLVLTNCTIGFSVLSQISMLPRLDVFECKNCNFDSHPVNDTKVAVNPNWPIHTLILSNINGIPVEMDDVLSRSPRLKHLCFGKCVSNYGRLLTHTPSLLSCNLSYEVDSILSASVIDLKITDAGLHLGFLPKMLWSCTSLQRLEVSTQRLKYRHSEELAPAFVNLISVCREHPSIAWLTVNLSDCPMPSLFTAFIDQSQLLSITLNGEANIAELSGTNRTLVMYGSEEYSLRTPWVMRNRRNRELAMCMSFMIAFCRANHGHRFNNSVRPLTKQIFEMVGDTTPVFKDIVKISDQCVNTSFFQKHMPVAAAVPASKKSKAPH